MITKKQIMSISRKYSKSSGRSWLADMVANTPTLSKKRSTAGGGNGLDQLFYKNGSGSIRSTSNSMLLYPIITGSFASESPITTPNTPYPIITSSRQRSISLQQKPFNQNLSGGGPFHMKAATLKSRKKLSARKLYDHESLKISENSEKYDGKKYSATPNSIPQGQQQASVEQQSTNTSTLYDSVALDVPSISQGYKSNKPTAHIGHYRKNEQKKTFIESGCKTLDRNHFSRIRVRLFFFIKWVFSNGYVVSAFFPTYSVAMK